MGCETSYRIYSSRRRLLRFLRSQSTAYVRFYNLSIHFTHFRSRNFKVTLEKGLGGVQNNGMGTLILPSRKVGDKLMKWIGGRKHKITINGCDMRVFRSQKPSTRGLSQITQTLEKTPYLEPEIEEERERSYTPQVGCWYTCLQNPVWRILSVVGC